MYFICSDVSFLEISSPNECDKILKIQNEQTEPTDYTANCSTDCSANDQTHCCRVISSGKNITNYCALMKGPPIKYVTLFLMIFDPPVTNCHKS